MTRDRQAIRVLFYLGLVSPLFASPTPVSVAGRKLLVAGQSFTVQSVNYSPTPVGSTVQNPSPNCVGPYHWWTDRPTYVADFPLIGKMGANTIRTFDLMNSAQTTASVLQALDTAQTNGLHVIMGYSMPTFQAFNISTATVQSEVLAAVASYKDHPAVLMWALGNEINLTQQEGGDPAWSSNAWYAFLDQLSAQVKAADPNHPVMSAEGEILNTPNGDFRIGNDAVGIQADDAHMTHLDIWGINVYRGKTFEGVIQRFAVSTTTVKPILVSEFGKDAFRDAVGGEDQDMQADYISSQWQEIRSNLSATAAGSQNLIGGSVFEWTDEWWKDSSNDCLTHGGQTLFTRSDDTIDPNYQNEWFGITAVQPIDAISNPAGTQRTLRKGYSALQAFWNPTVTPAGAARSFFADTVRNYPNPFQLGGGSTKFVVLANEAGSVDIRIFDAGAQFVTSFIRELSGPGRIEIIWDGHNGQGSLVSSGLYVAKIHGHSALHDETQYRRVVGVK